jgi:hypothetical protein
MQRDSFGMPDLVPVIDHPLSTLSDAKSDRRAEQAMFADLARVMRADGRSIAIDAMPYSVYTNTQRR